MACMSMVEIQSTVRVLMLLSVAVSYLEDHKAAAEAVLIPMHSSTRRS
jgi:hypothetical protein